MADPGEMGCRLRAGEQSSRHGAGEQSSRLRDLG